MDAMQLCYFLHAYFFFFGYMWMFDAGIIETWLVQ